LIIDTNGRWGGLCHNTEYGEIERKAVHFSILVISFSSREAKKKDIARKVNVKKKKRPLK